jgi:hypothetical protein
MKKEMYEFSFLYEVGGYDLGCDNYSVLAENPDNAIDSFMEAFDLESYDVLSWNEEETEFEIRLYKERKQEELLNQYFVYKVLALNSKAA